MKAKIKCPKCNFIQEIEVPKNKCIPFYRCNYCKNLIKAKEGSCCVVCDYSDKTCPVSGKFLK